MNLDLDIKSGFCCADNKIVVCDHRGIFYYKKNSIGKKIFFNLPKGNYVTPNFLKKIPVIKYNLKQLAKPNSITDLPKNGFKLSFGINKNKCTVDLNDGTVFFDNEFKKKETFILDYILLHELGHYFYKGENNKSEINCDKFASNCMLVYGYNPSQIRLANEFTLSDSKNSLERKKEIFNLTKNAY